MLIIFLLGFSISSLGQKQVIDDKNLFAGRFGLGMGDVLETWGNMKMEKIRNFIPQQDILAVRICANDPLSVALETAFFSPIDRVEELASQGVIAFDDVTGEPKSWQYYVPKNRAIFLRQNKNCRITKDKPADVEYWVVRPNNELPEFVEARKASEIFDYNVVADDTYFKNENYKKGKFETNHTEGEKLTPEIYQTALTALVKFMKEKRTALTVIKIKFYGRFPSKTIINRVLEAQRFLKQNDIGSHRIFVRKIAYGNDAPSGEYTDKYPSISVVCEK